MKKNSKMERKMNLFAKTGPWVVASLIATTSIFGQNNKCAPAQKSFEQGHEMTQSQMMAGYNAPSRIDVRGSWDVFATGSFTYWQPIQENMELGAVYNTADVSGIDANIVNPNFDYKPGFKVGLGMNFDHDNWDTFVQYTWFRGSHTTTTSLDSTETSELLPLRAPLTGHYYFGSQKWKLHMDILDWELARSSYVGTKLTFRPFFAARAAWIRQNLNEAYKDRSGTPNNNDFVSDKTQSWAVGPRAGLYTNWMIGEGFRMYGNGAGDILFTQYTKLTSALSTQTGSVTANDLTTHQHKLNTIRTHLDLELGFAWGSYFDNNNWHVDLSAGYGFQVFFDQNMFRNFTYSSSDVLSNSPNGNLYVHGLTATARFDF
jgi:hypothetical protein